MIVNCFGMHDEKYARGALDMVGNQETSIFLGFFPHWDDQHFSAIRLHLPIVSLVSVWQNNSKGHQLQAP